ncbi:MAG: hypothetical protein LR015_10485 [Verrucomicrobia bacterium]|nr:hypothetical protein [Verrucomicrobiota bacterium]
MESGADNGPVYDDAQYNSNYSTLDLADVGLMALFVADTLALVEMAEALGHHTQQTVLQKQAAYWQNCLSSLWRKDQKIYAYRHLNTGEYSEVYTPCCLWPLLTPKNQLMHQDIQSMLARLFDSNHFGGRWMLPAVVRNHPSYREQDYWRGRIWPPYQFITWLALREANAHEQASKLLNNSLELLERNWSLKHRICENFDAESGWGGEGQSDPFYTWGALPAFAKIWAQRSDCKLFKEHRS